MKNKKSNKKNLLINLFRLILIHNKRIFHKNLGYPVTMQKKKTPAKIL